MSVKKTRVAIAITAAAGGLVLGGATLANAAAGTPAPAAASGHGTNGPGASADTPVTGDELTKVTAAVRAKDDLPAGRGPRATGHGHPGPVHPLPDPAG